MQRRTKRLVFLMGTLAFTLLSFLLSNLVLKIEIVGSGSVYESETLKALNDMGIKKYSLFSSFSCDKLAKEVLRVNDKLSFVSAEKQGNRLVVKLESTSVPPTLLRETRSSLHC